MRFLRNFELEAISFWLGFLAASLFWWLLRRFSSQLKTFWGKFKEFLSGLRETLVADVEVRYRGDIYRHAQGLHLASELFALDEIVIEPRVLALPTHIIPGQIPPHMDITSETIPYTPDWPELAAHYQAKAFTMSELITSGTNLAIISPPGYGKTTALAYLTCQLAQSKTEIATLDEKIPFLLYAPDFIEEFGATPLEKLTNAITNYLSSLTIGRFAEFVQSSFRHGDAVLLVDGIDELSSSLIDETINQLKLLYDQFPGVQIVLAVDTEYFGDLSQIKAQPVALQSWGHKDHLQFLDKWSTQWQRWIAGPQMDIRSIDPRLINHWLILDAHTYSPLELTLKTWAAFANDLAGSHPTDIIANYIARQTNNDTALQTALEQTAFDTLISRKPLINAESGPAVLFSTPELSQPEDSNEGMNPEGEEDEDLPKTGSETVIQQAGRANSRIRAPRLLIPRARNTFGFRNPVILSYLASRHINTGAPTPIIQLPQWSQKRLALSFLSYYQDTTPYFYYDTNAPEDPLYTQLIVLARAMRYMPENSPRQSSLMEQIASTIHRDDIPLSIRSRLFSALITLNNPNIGKVVKHFRGSAEPAVRQLAALGSGFLRDPKTISELTYYLQDSPMIAKSACLALVQIGTNDALEAVIHVLLEADEDLRRAAAEALANHPEEGYPVLIDGTQIDDLLVRRAVIFGLRRTQEDWATAKLREIQIEEGQWVVRDAAEGALAAMKEPDPGLPKPFADLINLPWLIAYAGEYGQGIGSQEAARDMLLSAFRRGTVIQKIEALSHLELLADDGIFPDIYDLLFGPDFELNETAANAIWHLQRYGMEIPSPSRYGFN